MATFQNSDVSPTGSSPSWLVETQTNLSLLVHVQPGAKRDGVCDVFNGRLKISLCAPPVDGKANDRLIRFLAKRLGIPRSCLTLASGQSSRDKRLTISGLSYEQALVLLAP